MVKIVYLKPNTGIIPKGVMLEVLTLRSETNKKRMLIVTTII